MQCAYRPPLRHVHLFALGAAGSQSIVVKTSDRIASFWSVVSSTHHSPLFLLPPFSRTHEPQFSPDDLGRCLRRRVWSTDQLHDIDLRTSDPSGSSRPRRTGKRICFNLDHLILSCDYYAGASRSWSLWGSLMSLTVEMCSSKGNWPENQSSSSICAKYLI